MVERETASRWRVLIARLDDVMLLALILLLLPLTIVVIGAPVALVLWLSRSWRAFREPHVTRPA